MKGYKAFNKDLTCKGMQYKVGEIFEINENPICCKRGFHFCKNITDVYKFYAMSDDTRICEIEALGDIVTDDVKYCTNKIKIIKEICSKEIKHCNVDKTDAGYCNSGNRNSGNYNSGNCNSGNCNSGYCNSGYCNTNTPKVRMFNQQTDMDFTDERLTKFRNIMYSMPNSYVYSNFILESNMSEEEKESHPEYKMIGGYIKTISVEGNKWKWWNEEVSEEDKEFIRSLPYYDEDIFFESTGIKEDMDK